MEYFAIKNWQDFQQYKDREPKWIKVYRTLLIDYKYEQLTDAEFGQLVKIWLLASQLDNKIPNDPAWIQRKTGMTAKPNINKYLQLDFLKLINCVQNCTDLYKNVLREEKRREEKEKTCVQNFFDLFWQNYPKKKNKGDAEKAWKALKADKALIDKILAAIEQQKKSEDWVKDSGKFIPYPASWIRGKRWEDEIITDDTYGLSPSMRKLLEEEKANAL